jgi:hypothetical protein
LLQSSYPDGLGFSRHCLQGLYEGHFFIVLDAGVSFAEASNLMTDCDTTVGNARAVKPCKAGKYDVFIGSKRLHQ